MTTDDPNGLGLKVYGLNPSAADPLKNTVLLDSGGGGSGNADMAVLIPTGLFTAAVGGLDPTQVAVYMYIKMGEFGSATGADPSWNVDATAEQWANFALSTAPSVPEPEAFAFAATVLLLGFAGIRRVRQRE